jgi:hypothetical protein
MTNMPSMEPPTRISTTCYAHRLREAKIKLGLPENATVDDILRRVIHGNAEQELSLEAWLQLGKKFINQDRA